MEKHEIITPELLIILEAMEIAADAYQAEANRTGLRGFGRSLLKKSDRIRAIASNLKNRAFNNTGSGFARAHQEQINQHSA